MNIFKKFYCRVFQGAFRLALPILPYREPKILNSVTEIPDLLESKNISSVMLVTDAGIRGCGITKPLEELMKKKMEMSVMAGVVKV